MMPGLLINPAVWYLGSKFKFFLLLRSEVLYLIVNFFIYLRNILIAANLDDFNVFFVRKQWSNMLARYKQYKVSVSEEVWQEIKGVILFLTKSNK